MNSFSRLINLIETLRGKDGCPWDKKQTIDSIKPFVVEECYELVEAIDEGSLSGIKEELGDLLFHIFFIAEITKEIKAFDINDVVEHITKKMIRRHPHVFGNKKVKNAKEVELNWSELKAKEKQNKRSSLMDGLPKSLPALIRAFRLTERASKVGFDWEKASDIFPKIKEELSELEEEIKKKKINNVEEEVGDLLFVIANLARLLKINPEDALRKSVNKFEKRFRYIEKSLKKEGKSLNDATLEEMDKLWEKAKEKEG
ncbi:MAG: nucleoside triphosphate pyrophosphohydrolase [Spirochaetes bacterium]|nr:nucleoside triphosphate pyrophosphohydrolase [Deltaproteobacteria bacterium]RKY00304.1 MAG: nucleoside triphosphate pyrophosphohydrolase [Spirochaetota bacterium]